MNTKKAILIIMDGWGIAKDKSVSAIDLGHTPFYDSAIEQYPNMKLQASGLAVGLPEGQMGNSEVGHMNIGAGRVVYQDLVRINLEVQDREITNNLAFQSLLSYCKSEKKPLHLMGLLSDGGVHSSIVHLLGILKLIKDEELPAVYIHCFMDGRDTAPNGGKQYLADLEACLAETGVGKIASLIGRYYAMDRDKRWERVKLAYDLIVKGEGTAYENVQEAIQASYDDDVTDEFVKPVVMMEEGKPVATLQDGDAVLFFNFRTDRGRELTQVLTQEDMPEHGMQTLKLHYTTMTRYDETFKGIEVLYEKPRIEKGLGEILSQYGKTQIRIAETEKYPHVTFFFNGGEETPFEGEKRIMRPSPKVATYDLQPEMSAYEIRDAILPEIKKGEVDFICLNFANPDMVGHTGVIEAAIKACEVVDSCTKEVAETALAHGYNIIITADHGNADRMRNPDKSVHTAHTTSLVPCIFMTQEALTPKPIGKLGDLAPTLLHFMGIPQPKEMTGELLLELDPDR